MVVLLLALVAVAVVIGTLAVATGRWPVDPLAEATHTTPDHGLPEHPGSGDVDDVRFDTAARGYRMEDVDARLDVLRVELAARERRLEVLERAAATGAGSAPRPGDGDAGEVAPGDRTRGTTGEG